MSVERCKELFLEGHNCAQAVLGGFAEEIGLTEEKAMALASCFGAGICGTRNICGALTGGLAVLGAMKNKISPDDKKAMYDEGKKFIERFKSEFSSENCKTLLENVGAYYEANPLKRDENYYKTRPCLAFVAYVAEELESACGAEKK